MSDFVVENTEDDLRKRAAGEEFEAALGAASVSLLRVIAGAGSPGRVLRELNHCTAPASAYQEARDE